MLTSATTPIHFRQSISMAVGRMSRAGSGSPFGGRGGFSDRIDGRRRPVPWQIDQQLALLCAARRFFQDVCSPVTHVTRLLVTAVMCARARNADNQWKYHKRHNESPAASVFKANPWKNQPFLV